MVSRLIAAFVLTACGTATHSSTPSTTNANECRPTHERFDAAMSMMRGSYTSPKGPIGEACKCGNGKIDTCVYSDRGGCLNVSHPCDPGPEQQESRAEPCDGDDLGGKTCQQLGFASGQLRCSSACQLDTSGCELAPLQAKNVPIADIPAAIAANDRFVLVVTVGRSSMAPTLRRYDHDLHLASEETIPGSFDGLAPTPTGFFVAVRDESGPVRKGAIYEVPNFAPAHLAFAFDDGRVVMLYTVRGEDGRLRDPFAVLVPPKDTWSILRVKIGEKPVRVKGDAYGESHGVAIETKQGILLPSVRFADHVQRIHADGTTDRLALPIECPASVRLAPGYLSYIDGAITAKLLRVNEDLHADGPPIDLGTRTRFEPPTFLGDVLWLGENDFVHLGKSEVVHLPKELEPFGLMTRFGSEFAVIIAHKDVRLAIAGLP